MPDLWADTNGDGLIGSGDVLFEIVDLNAYTVDGNDDLASVNARFTPGQAFTIVNGQVDGLPGVLLSTTEPTFSPSGGYSGTPYTGTGMVYTYHGDSGTVPEPSTLSLLCLAANSLLAFAWRKRRRTV